MIGFVYKDFLLMRRQLTYILFLTVLYAVLCGTGVLGPFILPALVVIVSMIFPMSAFAYDEQARWDKFAAATPAGRRGMVAGRYLFALLLVLLTSALVTVLLLIFGLLGLNDGTWAELFLPVPACAAVGLGMNAVLLPLLYKFGAEKARIIGIIVFAAIVGGFLLLNYADASGNTPQRFDVSFPVVLLLLAVAVVAGFAVSFRIALGIFARKEL